jgi:hypothetical protein
MRKNLGIILMMLGVLMTIDKNINNTTLYIILDDFIEMYWPILLSFVGIYLISKPKKHR